MDCFYCASLWVAMPIAYWLSTAGARVVVWLALSGGAMLLERVVRVTPSARQ